MGNFYVNYTLRGPSQQDVAHALKGRRAAATPYLKECVVVFDEASDSQDDAVILQLAASVSKSLSCPCLSVLNHDDDILKYWLHVSGALEDEYDSNPGYFDFDSMKGLDWGAIGSPDDLAAAARKLPSPPPPKGGNALKLCEAFGSNRAAEVESILQRCQQTGDKYVFEVERHHDLIQAIGLPEFAVGTSFASFAYGEFPAGLTEEDILFTE
ncbi:hypothetical protein [Aeoliella sp.]|uniref:hypothetical protein n=1 Tax=Aeoliella sp. TaxID=2795800 RepID=UPI003CCC112F